MSDSLVSAATTELAKLFAPLRRLDNPRALGRLVRELGWDFDAEFELVVDLEQLVDAAQKLVDDLVALAQANSDQETEERLATVTGDVFAIVVRLQDDVPAIQAAVENVVGDVADLAQELPRRLFDWLLFEYLAAYRPRTLAVLNLLGIVEVTGGETAPAYRSVHWERLSQLFSDPLQLAEDVYQWTTDFNGDEFIERAEFLMRAFGLAGGSYTQSESVHSALERELGDDLELRIPLYQGGSWPDSYQELDLNVSPVPALNVSPVPAGGTMKAGLALYPRFYGGLDLQQDLGNGWQVELGGNARLNVGLGLTLRPPHEFNLTTSLFSEQPLPASSLRVELGVRKGSEDQSLSLLFGSLDGTHLGARSVGFKLGVGFSLAKQELTVEFEITELTLAVTSDLADGFLQKVLSGVNIRSKCDLAVGVSNLDGVYFRGSSGLEVEIPLHVELGPIALHALLIGLRLADGLELALAASFGCELGPIAAQVNLIGLTIPVAFPGGTGGNLGPVDVKTPQFKSPTGAGLSLDAGPISGGGFLDFDTKNERYAGILALSVGEIAIVAIGLITTKLPDGTKGFSLLVNIGVVFDPPIQLFSGFTLSGVGGLVGINRSMEIDVLRKGIKQRTLDSILFPDPATVVANASKIISDLRAVFPPSDGDFVVGPMVKLGWGSPNIVTADIGVFVQFPDPIRIVLMGQVEAALPEAKEALVVIHLDVLGVVDFEKQELTFQASIYDSRVLTFSVSGDSAFFFSWGPDPRFALSLGGFHPKFTPPPPPIVFAGLERLSLNISSGKEFQLQCRAYQALTPNSLQFGARVDLYAAVVGAEVTGFMGFDVLFYFSPFSFEAWIGAGVSLKYEGISLADVNLDFTLSGPTPWNARGKAKIHVLFVDVDIDFHETWGQSGAVTIPAADPWDRLRAALHASENWGSAKPSGRGMLEALGPGFGTVGDAILVHPVGGLEIRQNVVPLKTTITRMGNAPVKGSDRFEVSSVKLSGSKVDFVGVQEYFSRGQFEALRNDQKLSVPSFERMQAGVVVDQRVRAAGDFVAKAIDYEALLIRSDRTTEPAPGQADPVAWADAEHIVAVSQRRREVARASTGRRLTEVRPSPAVTMAEESYCIASAKDLTRTKNLQSSATNQGMTRMQADSALKEHLAAVPGERDLLLVVPEHEVAA